MNKLNKKGYPFSSLVAVFIGCMIGSVGGNFYLGLYDNTPPPPDISDFYVDPSSASKREDILVACLNNGNISPNECEVIARKVYGIAGFRRGGRIYPCFRAASPNEKLACGGME